MGIDSDLIKGLKLWIQKQVFDDFSTVVGRSDREISRIICAADTLATLMELGIESDVSITKPGGKVAKIHLELIFRSAFFVANLT